MALQFDDNAEHVAVTHPALDRLDAMTLMMWYRADTVSSAATYTAVSKLFSAGNDQFLLWRPSLAPNPDDWAFFHRRASTATFVRSTGNIIQSGRWEWLCVLDSDGALPKFLHATLSSPPSEPAYYSRTAGFGAATDDSGQAMNVGRAIGSASQTFSGRIGFLAIFNRRLSDAEAAAQWRRPRPVAGCVHFVHAGSHGLSWVDLSGAKTTGTPAGGPTPAPGVPLAMPIVRRGWTARPDAGLRRIGLGSALPAGGRVLLID